ncbi:MAG: hypothetical protein RQ856_01905 [Candidatus Izemoplasmatales bacterium]|nr:hypothetical protein [Candidatus Izemoplasmatales bacterium]
MFETTLYFILKIIGFSILVLLVKLLISLIFKNIKPRLIIPVIFLISPLYFYVVFTHDILFGRLSFYTIVLLIFTISLFEYNILIKRLFKVCSGLKISSFILVTNLIAYGLSEVIITFYFS